MAIRKSHKFRRFIGVIALASGFVGTCVWIVNRPETLSHALALANARSAWKIEVSSLRWTPLRSEFEIKGIGISEPATGKRLTADRVDLSYSLLGLLRGKLVVDSLKISSVDILLTPSARPRERRAHRRINTAKLLLLKNIELLDGNVAGITIAFGDKASLIIDEVRTALVPSIFGDARLAVRADGIKLDKGGRSLLTAGFASLKTSTRLERWSDEFPYANSFSGDLAVQDASFEGTRAEKIDAEVSFEDGIITLEEFAVLIEGRELRGRLIADTHDQSFELDIDIPKPLTLPHLGKDLLTFDTGGALSGKIGLKGTGFIPKRSIGSGKVALTHRFDASSAYPVSVSSDVSWNHGLLRFESGRARVEGDEISFSGSIDLNAKAMDITASATGFPIEHFFNTFKNPHLRKIFGRSDVEATVTGWGKNVDARITGTTYDGGWRPIKADRIETKVDITYHELLLSSTIYSGKQQTGSAELKVLFGARMADGTRRKNVDLNAELHDMPLAGPMEAFALEGIGTGSITLSGPHTDFVGKAHGSIENGSWHKLPFNHAALDLDITRRKLEFKNIEIGLPHAPVSKLTGSLTADLSPGRMRLHGEPLAGLVLDSTYLYAPSRWTVKSLTWTDSDGVGGLEVKGQVVSDGPVNMTAKGLVNATAMSLLTPSLYRGSGDIDVDLTFRGTTKDPRINGRIKFQDNGVLLRKPRVDLEKLNGTLAFEGSRVRFDDITAAMEDGSMRLEGYFDHRNSKPTYADLGLETKGMTWRSEDGYLMLEFEGNLKLEGRFPSPLLSGDMTILDGKYTKDFTLLDAITGGSKERERERETERLDFDPRLELTVRNTGDMEIRNNVGDIWLNVNIAVSGTRSKPVVAGSVNTSEGEVHYLGLKFDVTKGFLEFRGNVDAPYLEVYAEKEINVYNVNLVLHGPIDNLALDLTATSPTGPLEKRDVVSLLLFGVTEQERIAMQGSGVSPAMVAQSITSVIERPISKFTKLDVFRFETADADSSAISRLNVGKRLSDRLTLSFATDIGVDNAVQTFGAEYQITDNLMLKGAHTTDSTYELSGFLRFRLR